MRVSHVVSPEFDDPNFVSHGGLVPVMALAQRCGLHQLAAARLTLRGEGSANPSVKVAGLVAGMVAGADSIDDMDVLRHGGMGRVFDGVRAPSTLGTFLRGFTFGHVRQLDAVAAGLLANLAAATPLLGGVDQVCFVDVDDTIRATHGYAKQGVGYGYSKVKGLNALLATVSTPLAAPVIAATRLRRGSTNSARGAARLVADALVTAANAGASGLRVVRADSAYYAHDVIAAARRAGARFSVTARANPAVTQAIAGIDEQSWTPIRYPQAIWDETEQRWVSDAEVAEVGFTAFTSRRKTDHVDARLIVRRVKRLNPAAGRGHDQGELFCAYRYHAVFTDSPLPMLEAEACHRQHAIIEQVIADLKAGPLAHLPSGRFTANGAWLVLVAMAFNLTRAAGCAASGFHARATTATIRTQLIQVAARVARSARRLVLHLPRGWPGSTPGTRCSPSPADHPPPRPLDHRAPTGATGDQQWKSRADRPAPHAHTPSTDTNGSTIPQQRAQRMLIGGSGFSAARRHPARRATGARHVGAVPVAEAGGGGPPGYGSLGGGGHPPDANRLGERIDIAVAGTTAMSIRSRPPSARGPAPAGGRSRATAAAARAASWPRGTRRPRPAQRVVQRADPADQVRRDPSEDHRPEDRVD